VRVCLDLVRLGLLVEPEPLADLRHEAAHEGNSTPFARSTRGAGMAREATTAIDSSFAPLAGLGSFAAGSWEAPRRSARRPGRPAVGGALNPPIPGRTDLYGFRGRERP
jgi:hypothetical protein